MTAKLKVLDLFSGIGGFSLGLERTGGFETVAFCEIDPFCQKVLKKHWPDIPIFEDVRKLNGRTITADIVCGGFPCQPFSSAARGRTKGTTDHRFLWPEMLRVIREVLPTWVIGENVTNIDRLALEQVVSDLEASGYEVAPPLEIPACAIGHDHRRSRYWFLGYADRNREPRRSLNAEASWLPGNRFDPGSPRATNGFSGGMDANRQRAIGNAVVPQIPELIGRAILKSMEAL